MPKHLAISFISFAFFKAVVFFSVLIFSFFGYSEEYVLIEKYIAFSSMLVPFVIFGATTTFSHYKINFGFINVEALYWAHALIAGIFLGTLSLFFLLFCQDTLFYILALTVLFLYARFYSQPYKIENNVSASSFYDAFPYFIFIFTFFVIYFGGDFKHSSTLSLLILIVFYVVFTLLKVRRSKPFPSQDEVKFFYSFGGKAFIVSGVTTFIIMAPRAFASNIAHEVNIESYYLSLRYIAILVLFYQFISIRWFVSIYKVPVSKIGFLCLAMYFVSFFSSFALLNFLHAFSIIPDDSFLLYAANICALWILSSCLEYYISREGGVAVFLKSLTSSAIAMSLFYFIFNPSHVFFMTLVVSLFVLVQYFSIVKCSKNRLECQNV